MKERLEPTETLTAEQQLVHVAMKRVREGSLMPGPMEFGQPYYSSSVYQRVLLSPRKFPNMLIEITDNRVEPRGCRDLIGLRGGFVSVGSLASGLTIRSFEIIDGLPEEKFCLRLPRNSKLVTATDLNALSLKTLTRIIKRAKKLSN